MQTPLVPICTIALVLLLATLLGMWAALGRTRFLARCVAVGGGILTLGIALCIGLGEMESEWIVLVAFVTGFVTAITGVLRFYGVHVIHLRESSKTPSKELQFTIWNLMQLTLFVACLLGIGRILPFQIAAFALTLATCFASIAVSALWSTLGVDKVATRIATSMLVTVLATGIIYYAMEVSGIDPGLLWVIIIAAYWSLLTASLLGVRVYGYRLARSAHPPLTIRAPQAG